MFEGLRRLTKDAEGVPRPLPFTTRDWNKTMQTIQTEITTLEAAYETSQRAYADACLLASEGGDSEARERDKAYMAMEDAHKALKDAQAARDAAARRKQAADAKARYDAETAKAEAVAQAQRDLIRLCDEMDGTLDQLIDVAQRMVPVLSRLRQAGVRGTESVFSNVMRALATRCSGLGFNFGQHPFVRPMRLWEALPDLRGAINSALEKK